MKRHRSDDDDSTARRLRAALGQVRLAARRLGAAVRELLPPRVQRPALQGIVWGTSSRLCICMGPCFGSG
jgi:hypothetical protein